MGKYGVECGHWTWFIRHNSANPPEWQTLSRIQSTCFVPELTECMCIYKLLITDGVSSYVLFILRRKGIDGVEYALHNEKCEKKHISYILPVLNEYIYWVTVLRFTGPWSKSVFRALIYIYSAYFILSKFWRP